MRALLASMLMALALLWVSATGGRAPEPSPGTPSERTATLVPSSSPAGALLVTGQKTPRGSGFPPSPFLLPAPVPLVLPSAQLDQPPSPFCSPARGARLLAHGPRAPPV